MFKRLDKNSIFFTVGLISLISPNDVYDFWFKADLSRTTPFTSLSTRRLVVVPNEKCQMGVYDYIGDKRKHV